MAVRTISTAGMPGMILDCVNTECMRAHCRDLLTCSQVLIHIVETPSSCQGNFSLGTQNQLNLSTHNKHFWHLSLLVLCEHIYLSFFSVYCECLPKKKINDCKKITVWKGEGKGEQKQGLEKPTGILWVIEF